MLQAAVDPNADIYSGRLADEVVGLFDASLNVAAAAKAQAEEAQATCIPDFPPECDAANDALDDVLIELQKNFNAWREHQ